MKKPVTVLLVKVGQEPVPTLIGQDLPSLYAAIGCETIQSAPIGCGYDVWCDEDGLANGKPHNSCGIVGDYFISRTTASGYLRSLTPKQVTEATNYWRKYRHLRHPGDGGSVVTFDTPDEMRRLIGNANRSLDDLFRAAQN